MIHLATVELAPKVSLTVPGLPSQHVDSMSLTEGKQGHQDRDRHECHDPQQVFWVELCPFLNSYIHTKILHVNCYVRCINRTETRLPITRVLYLDD